MKSNIYTNLLLAFAVAGILVACGGGATPEKDKKAQLEKLKADQANLAKEIATLEAAIAKENPDAVTTGKAKEVSITEVTPQKFDYYVQTQGHVESENDVQVSAEAQGVIRRVFVTEGQEVSKGQVLAQIDNAVMSRNIESMKAQLELATSVYDRQKNLWDQKIGTEVQLLQAKTNKEALEKQIASAEEQNNMTRIKAPISGVVDEVNVKVGEGVSMVVPPFRIVNASELKLIAPVSEAYVTNIKKGNKVLVNVPELKKEIVATVTFVGKTINTMSRTFNVEVKLPTYPDLRPNMTATIKVVFNTQNSALVVPVNVIQTLNDEKVVYIAETQNKQVVARKKVVTIGGVYGNKAHVEGLAAGDKVITFGYQGLNDGDPIKI